MQTKKERIVTFELNPNNPPLIAEQRAELDTHDRT